MSEFIRKDQIHRVPIQGGELMVSSSHDFLHHFSRNGAWILKYWESNHEPPRFHNVVLAEEAAHWLMENCDLEVCERRFMGEQEHEHFMQWQEVNLGELDFEVDEPEADDTIEE